MKIKKHRKYSKMVVGLAWLVSMPLEFTCVYAAGKSKVSKITIEQTQIDHEFLRKMEGSMLKGYVPMVNSSKSGVTIANGVDLGQLGLSEFNKLPIEPSLKNKLRPYVGLKREKAQTFLNKHPLTITSNELVQLNKVTAEKILHPLVRSYNKASGTTFTSLPGSAQTAIFSFAYHYGPGFMKQKTSKQLWGHFVAQEWSQASQTLRNFKSYSSRRASEASLLDELA